MRLQNKFLALLLPAGLLAAGLILFLIQRSVHSVVLGSLEKSVSGLARAAAQDAEADFKAASEARLLPLLQSLQKSGGALYAAALDSRGTVLAHTSITEKGKVERDPVTLAYLEADQPVVNTLSFRDEPVLEVAVPVWASAEAAPEESFLFSGEARTGPRTRLGILKVGVPLKPALETEERIVRGIFLIVTVIGGIALLLVLLLVRGILRPITSLMEGISRIALGRYDVAVPVLSKDELGDLARSFNRMSGELARTTVSKEYVEGILENMVDLLIVADPEGRIETVNHAVTDALAFPAAELVGRPLSALLPMRQEELGALLTAGAVRDLEVTLRTKAGGSMAALFSASILKDRQGGLRGYICVVKDITERKRAEVALLAAKSAAETASKELEAFSYSVAHDLRAPLRAIDGFSRALLESYSGVLDEQGKGFLSRVSAGSRNMGQLIDDLLNLSRITRSAMRRERVDLSALARDVAEDLRKSRPERQVEFVIADGLSAEGDPNLLRVALVNLLGNAWKYTGKNPRARIEFGETREGGARAYFVRDDGAGFDMAFSKKLFKAFNRLHTAAEFEGTGIGLATVQRVVERHGGRIRGEGAVGKGATFFFTLWEANRDG